MARLSNALKATVVAIADAVKAGNPPYLFISHDDAKALTSTKPPLALANPTVADPEGKNRIAAILTADGNEAAEKFRNAKPRAAAQPLPAPADPSAIEIESDVPVPESKRGGRKSESPWPIDRLAVNQSFFIPATEETPEPWKRFQSLVSAATKRFNKAGSTDRRRFIIRESERNGAKGARIWRISDAEAGTNANDAAAQASAAGTPPAAGFQATA
jgi:hypothetical protein